MHYFRMLILCLLTSSCFNRDEYRLAEIEKDKFVERVKIQKESVECEYRTVNNNPLDCNGLDANNRYITFECHTKGCHIFTTIK
jgi:hypothetical protein